MTLVLQLPCTEDGTLTPVEITRDLQMSFSGYDIEEDFTEYELGGGESICMHALSLWQDDPIRFLCSGIIPLPYMGIVAANWVSTALRDVEYQVGKHVGCIKESKKLLKACRRFWSNWRKAPIKQVYVAKQNMVTCWNKACADRDEKHYGTQFPYVVTKAVDLVFDCASLALESYEPILNTGIYPDDMERSLLDIANTAAKVLVVNSPGSFEYAYMGSDGAIENELDTMWGRDAVSEVKLHLAQNAIQVLEHVR